MSFGGTVKLKGESEYRQALRQITRNLAEVSSEMKVVDASYDRNDKSTEALTAKNEILSKKLEEQRKKLDLAKGSLERMTAEQEKNKSAHTALISELDQEKSKLEKLKGSHSATAAEIKKQEEKVNGLESAVKSSAAALESGSNAISRMKVETNKAQAEVIKSTKAIDNNKQAMSRGADAVQDFAQEESNAGRETLKLGDLIKAHLTSEGVIAGIKGLGHAMAGVSRKLLSLGKQALNGFAQQEQLVGGIETLFGAGGKSLEEYAKSVGKSVDEAEGEYNRLIQAEKNVAENAQNAYQTVGKTANEYMDIVTGFSASLVASLAGDTVTASEYADMALRDMSDNANKMGSDMESIENAYQGFAKGNWSMLDNLKLGYGGSAREMARLVNASGVLGDLKIDLDDTANLGKALNDVGFAKIVKAIHNVQTEMHITGTTAKEAQSTITGSMDAAGASWENLVTGVADDSADFENLVNIFVQNVTIAAGNILPRVGTIIDGIVQLVVQLSARLVEHLPEIVKTGMDMIGSLVEGINAMIPSLMPIVVQLIEMLSNFIVQNLPTIINAGIQIIIAVAQGLAQALPDLIPVMVDSILVIVDTLLDNVDLIIDTGVALLIGLAEGLTKAIPKLIDKAPVIINKLCAAFGDNFPKIISSGLQILGSLTSGIIKGIPDMVKNIPQIFKAIVNTFKTFNFISIGRNIIKGICNGLTSAGDVIWAAVKKAGKAILNGIKKFFGIHSPASNPELIWESRMMAQGLGVGFTEEMQNVSKDMAESIPRRFDVTPGVGISGSYGNGYSYGTGNDLVAAFKQALSETKIVLDDEVAGKFIENTVTRIVYA